MSFNLESPWHYDKGRSEDWQMEQADQHADMLQWCRNLMSSEQILNCVENKLGRHFLRENGALAMETSLRKDVAAELENYT